METSITSKFKTNQFRQLMTDSCCLTTKLFPFNIIKSLRTDQLLSQDITLDRYAYIHIYFFVCGLGIQSIQTLHHMENIENQIQNQMRRPRTPRRDWRRKPKVKRSQRRSKNSNRKINFRRRIKETYNNNNDQRFDSARSNSNSNACLHAFTSKLQKDYYF